MLARPTAKPGPLESLKLGYTESRAIRCSAQRSPGCTARSQPDDVLIAAPEELIFIAMNTLLAGDHVIVAFPGYQSLYEMPRALGCGGHPLAAEADGEVAARSDCLSNHRPPTRLLVINFPHNPTGYLPTPDEWTPIIEIARRHGLYVFSDEMYRLLEYDDADPPARRCADLYERGISLSGLSKSFALPGLRIGWLAMRGSGAAGALHRVPRLHDHLCSAPSEILGSWRCGRRSGIVARNLRSSRGNRAELARFCAGARGRVHVAASRTPARGLPAASRRDGRWASSAEDVLDKRDVMIVPGSVFDHAGKPFPRRSRPHQFS